jgi:hypothetical protein
VRPFWTGVEGSKVSVERIILAKRARLFDHVTSLEAPMPYGKIYPDVTETVGNTPLIRLNRIAAGLPAKIVGRGRGCSAEG